MEGKPLYRTLTATGFGLVALAFVIGLLASRTTEFLGFVIVVIVITALAAFCVLRFPWGRWVGLAVAVLGQLFMFWLVFGLMAFNSVFDFAFSLIGEAGFVTAIVASVLRVRRGDERVFDAGHKRRMTLVGGVALALIALSGVLTITGQESVSESEAAGATRVDLDKSKFVPDELSAASGTAAKFVVHNSDLVSHTFTIKDEDAGVDVDEMITPGSEKLITFTASKSGALELTCNFHEEMTGTVTVT